MDGALAEKLQAGSYQTFDGTVREHFKPAGIRDAFWGVLFWLHFAGYMGFVGYRVHGIFKNQPELLEFDTDMETGYFPVLFAAMGIALVMALAWTILLRCCPKPVMYTAVFLPLVLSALAIGAAVYVKNYAAAGSAGVGFALTAFYIWCIWDCLAFTALLLQVTTEVIHLHWGTLFLTIGALLPSAVLLVCYVVAMGICKHDLEDADGNPQEAQALIILTVFSFYWTFATIGNVLHTTICGVIGRWYFLEPGRGATGPSLLQSITRSFGAVALGSFIMAVVRTLKLLCRVAQEAAEDSDNLLVMIVACVLGCVMSCIESLLEFISTYAFVYVAVYGTSFCEGARKTWGLLQGTGLHMVATWDMSGAVTFLGCLVAAGATGLATWAMITFGGPWLAPGGGAVVDKALVPAYIGFGAFVGMAAVAVVCSTIESGSSALLVCFAEEPSVIRERHPQLDAKIAEVFGSESQKRASKRASQRASQRASVQNVEGQGDRQQQ